MTRQCPGKSTTLIIILFILNWIALSGCATLGKDECLNADWFTIGYEDGAKGYPASRIGNHREACARHGVAPDFKRYEQGLLEGLREYCTPQRGYGLGVSGKSYSYVCPKTLESDFLEAYRQGKIVHGEQLKVNRQKNDLKKMHAKLAAVRQKLGDYETELVKDDSIGPKRRKYLLEEIKILTDEQRLIEAEIAEQKALFEMSKFNLKKIKAQNSY